MQILVATDFSTRSNRAVRQAGLLAQSNKATLHVLHVVDDDQPEDLVKVETREAQRFLGEHIAAMPELQGTHAQPMVVTGDPFDGILRAATEVGADLIVMGAHRKQLLLDIFVGTTVERVVRKGSFPVLMVNNEAQHEYVAVVAPTDMSPTSAKSIAVALSTGLISNRATLLHAFTPPAKGKLFIADVRKSAIDEYVETERQKATDYLVRFLIDNDLGHERWFLRIDEGDPMDVISQAMVELRPDLLVMGAHGRSGLAKVFLGSLTEEALRSANVDVLVVPPVKESA